MTTVEADEADKFDVDSINETLGTGLRAEQLEALGNSWVNDVEMYKMLESILPTVSSLSAEENLSDLDMGWDLQSFANDTGMVGINAF